MEVFLVLLLVPILLFILFYSDSVDISIIDKMHEHIKENKNITLKELTNKLGSDYHIHHEGSLKRYVWMKHSTGVPVRFLSVYFNESDEFVKYEFSIGFEDVI